MGTLPTAALLLLFLSQGCHTLLHHRSPVEGFHSSTLGETDELRVVLQEQPSTGYEWEPLFDDQVITLKQVSHHCPQNTSRRLVGQPCDVEMWFVGVSEERSTPVQFQYRRLWETSPPLRTISTAVTSLKPYRGPRQFSTLVLDEPPHSLPHSRHRAQGTGNLPLVYDPRVLPGFPSPKDQG
eukprot:RCo037668